MSGISKRGNDVGTSADFVHLIAVAGAEVEQSVAMIEAERAILSRETGAEGRLWLPDLGKPAPQWLWLELQDEVCRRRLEQERRELVGPDGRGDVQKLPICVQHLELCCRQPPRGGRTRRGPGRGHHRRLIGNGGRIGRECARHAPLTHARNHGSATGSRCPNGAGSATSTLASGLRRESLRYDRPRHSGRGRSPEPYVLSTRGLSGAERGRAHEKKQP